MVNTEMNLQKDTRLIVYHKQASSARTLFLRLPYGGVCGLAPLPEQVCLSDEHDDTATPPPGSPVLLGEAERCLTLGEGGLCYDESFAERLHTPSGPMQVYLASCTSIDPPFEAVRRIGGDFIALTDVRGIDPVELALLQRAYEQIMG